MKKCIALLLLVISLCGCGSGIIDPVEFYYQRSAYVYGGSDGVIVSETREASGHAGEYRYLLSLYLQGPLDAQLQSPFPSGCRLIDVQIEGDTMHVTMDSAFAELENMELTIACACLAKTCLSMADVVQVQIDAASPASSKNISITLSADSLMLEDESALPQQTITEDSQ